MASQRTLEELTVANALANGSGQTQTVSTAAGAVLQDPTRYEQFGGHIGGFHPPPLSRLRHFFIGPVGEGKSTLVASAPRTAILDVENKYTAIPYRGPGTMEFSGLSGQMYSRLIEELIADAKASRRAFDMVAIDPINAYVQVVRDQLTDEYIAAGLLKRNERSGTVIGDITSYGKGGLGWDTLNRHIITQLLRLHNAGYGISTTAHRFPKWFRNEDGTEVFGWQHKLNDGIRTFLYSKSEYVGIVSCDVQSVEESTGRTMTYAGRTIPEMRTIFRRTYTLDVLPVPTDQAALSLETRQHVPMGDKPIILPEDGGWQAYDQTYNEAVDRRRQQLQSKGKEKGE